MRADATPLADPSNPSCRHGGTDDDGEDPDDPDSHAASLRGITVQLPGLSVDLNTVVPVSLLQFCQQQFPPTAAECSGNNLAASCDAPAVFARCAKTSTPPPQQLQQQHALSRRALGELDAFAYLDSSSAVTARTPRTQPLQQPPSLSARGGFTGCEGGLGNERGRFTGTSLMDRIAAAGSVSSC